MARTARIKSKTNIYHIMIRGNNKQQIFLDEEDNNRFLEIIRAYKDTCNFKVFAYCLMGNHIHILIKTDDTPLEGIMKRIVVKFVYYYNVKYDRIGHLFQDRYKSEPVDTDEYFLQVIRYIHQNPVNAGICEKAEEYKYSSFNDYFSDAAQSNTIIDKNFALEMLPLTEFKKFHEYIDTKCKCIDVSNAGVRLSDSAAIDIINAVFQKKDIKSLNEQPKEIQREIAAILKSKGLSIRQISRLTGISKGIAEAR